jgi:phosphoribosylaminoimidazolecarboxamide formyltransferase/IMP cyclohydrolase
MTDRIKIKSALISVYNKDGILELAGLLESFGIQIISTGGTFDFLTQNNIHALSVESISSYPSILGGRVKTLHPKIFGGILWRRDQLSDVDDVEKYEIPSVDMVVVDLYPFEKTVATTNDQDEIIEKIDIGGISLIRAAAKNFSHVMVVPSAADYQSLMEILRNNCGYTSLQERKYFAAKAFEISSHYDTQIFNYFNQFANLDVFKQSVSISRSLRYGENPHQKATFFGDLEQVFIQLHGKELSYNNLVDIDAAINLIKEFSDPTVAIIKHTNPCGIASRSTLKQAYIDALACDPVSAYGGIIIANQQIQSDTAAEIDKLFFEILIADDFSPDALERLKSKKNRILLQKKSYDFSNGLFKSSLNGVLFQERDLKTENENDFQYVTDKRPDKEEINELVFANKIVKHLKSNTIVLVKNHQLIGSGMGQTSRVDALKQAILKANTFGFDTAGSVMASDAFFPFADSVEIAHNAGVKAVIQPGGSVRDSDSVKFCNSHNIAMIFTGIRHFKH